MSVILFAQEPVVISLWANGAPNDNGMTAAKATREDVAEPTLTVYLPERPNGVAIIMCPGGGYAGLALGHEGHDMAAWFNAQGITYAVLKYRMPHGHWDVPLSDAEQAMRIVRSHANEWKIDPSRVGIMGASAGGHLAASLSTLYSSENTRPDFQILFYPVISMGEITHGGSRMNLLGKDPDSALIQKFSLENQVNKNTPQAFIMFSGDDKDVLPANSINYAEALLREGIPVSMHMYPTGKHGWGFRDQFIYKRQWTGELEQWLRQCVEK